MKGITDISGAGGTSERCRIAFAFADQREPPFSSCLTSTPLCTSFFGLVRFFRLSSCLLQEGSALTVLLYRIPSPPHCRALRISCTLYLRHGTSESPNCSAPSILPFFHINGPGISQDIPWKKLAIDEGERLVRRQVERHADSRAGSGAAFKPSLAMSQMIRSPWIALNLTSILSFRRSLAWLPQKDSGRSLRALNFVRQLLSLYFIIYLSQMYDIEYDISQYSLSSQSG